MYGLARTINANEGSPPHETTRPHRREIGRIRASMGANWDAGERASIGADRASAPWRGRATSLVRKYSIAQVLIVELLASEGVASAHHQRRQAVAGARRPAVALIGHCAIVKGDVVAPQSE